MIVAATAPRNRQPSKGVLRALERKRSAATSTAASGARIVMSAAAPGVSVPALDPKNPCRIRGVQLDEPAHGEHVAVDQPVERQRHRRLEADDAERRPVELHGLLIGVVRRVVGGDGVDAAVREPFQHRVAVRLRAQRAGSS